MRHLWDLLITLSDTASFLRGPHERRLIRDGVHVAEHPVVLDEPDRFQCALVAQPTDDGTGLWRWVLLRPGISREDREGMCAWAHTRLERLVRHGAEPDGWKSQSDGRWSLWGTHVELTAELTNLPEFDGID